MFASFDPVALDLACADAVNRQPVIEGSVLSGRNHCHGDHFTDTHPDTNAGRLPLTMRLSWAWEAGNMNSLRFRGKASMKTCLWVGLIHVMWSPVKDAARTGRDLCL